MADDLEAFLRQAAQRRAARKKSALARPTQSRPQPSGSRPAKTPSRPAPVRNDGIEIVEATVMPDEADRLDTQVDTSRFARRAEHMGEKIGMADENLEERLHEKFDHQLGALDDAPGMPAAPAHRDSTQNDVPAVANEIAALLARPDSIRKAIILSEILAPPHDRW